MYLHFNKTIGCLETAGNQVGVVCGRMSSGSKWLAWGNPSHYTTSMRWSGCNKMLHKRFNPSVLTDFGQISLNCLFFYMRVISFYVQEVSSFLHCMECSKYGDDDFYAKECHFIDNVRWLFRQRDEVWSTWVEPCFLGMIIDDNLTESKKPSGRVRLFQPVTTVAIFDA